ncbi:methytransferase partner Trm112 [Methanosphaerula subterraneus]|uniref:methytransferase partner Trm112 n=1 Tax=Methanosphaerula subterraneus TaxID=3350244 RepID=UPI003F8768FB
MRRSMMEILCCPICKGDLSLQVAEENESEVLEGTLFCAACRTGYPIHDGIPDLLPKQKTA